MNYRAILYDFDGVIRHWDETETATIERQFNLPSGAIAAVAFEPALLERALTGRIFDETWRLAARNALGRAHGPQAAAAIDRWSEGAGRVDPAMVTLIAALRPTLRTALITNATTRLETDLQVFKLDQAFDVVASSARIGFIKPDRRIYHVAAVRLGFLPEQCIYVDDTDTHVAAAREFGMTAVRFEDVAALRVELTTLGVLAGS